jgi:hypothetical protein
MTQTPTPFDVQTATIPQVLEEVNSGRLSPEDALAQERTRDSVRSTLVEELEKLAKPVNNDTAAPSTTATAQTANENAEAEAEENPNGYEKARVKTAEKVNRNTGGLGTYFDPELKQSVGKEPVTVYVTPFIDGLLRNKELVKAR